MKSDKREPEYMDMKYKEWCDREAGPFGVPRYLRGVVCTPPGNKPLSINESCCIPMEELYPDEMY